jgi:MYXO-CTERM domain-containing protein
MLTGATSLIAPPRASACGGFFCDNSQPVNQAAERIIFSHDAEGNVTAVIQIQYSGPAEDFAWVLPVAGSPTVGVSSNAAFQRLQQATNPQYQLTTRIEGSCLDGFTDSNSEGFPPRGAFSDAASAADAGSSVTVVDRGSVGPYDYIVISVDPSAVPLSDVAVQWLRDNDFDIDERGASLLQPYLEGGMNLLAFRLTKGNDTGSIRPVSIGFGRGLASIPIRPTAVAAVENMGVLVWVLGEHRAVPINYASLELNEALINWLSPGSNYNDVVNRAADEAGGQGFVTEMAGAAAPLADMIFSSWEQERWSTFREGDWAGREGELLNSVVGEFGSLDGMRDVLAESLPLPEGATLDAVLSCVFCYFRGDEADIAGFEPATFISAVQTQVIDPMQSARELFQSLPFVTRFYTTMSAAEMTRDPSFDFNADLGEVSNVHMAERVIECSPSVRQFEAPWRIVLPNGEVVRGSASTWPFVATDAAMPGNARISRIGTEGTGEVIADNTGVISAALRSHNESIPAVVPPPRASATCGCRVENGATSAPLVGLLGLAALVFVRRRSKS